MADRSNARVLSLNVAVPRPDPGGAGRISGIGKRPTEHIDVFAPGPDYGDGSGVVGDVIGDSKHHGGAQKAVYASVREEAGFWWGEPGRPGAFTNGAFGENLTTVGVELGELLINQRVRIGTAELEVPVVRQPCRTFAGWGEKGWVKKFNERGLCGAYFRVAVPGRIAAECMPEMYHRRMVALIRR